ncbi:MAG: hypothetical protein FWG51_01740 [Firmicutes bacterium]|nr:hypothetical protein [Bacillota bacterium]
MKKKRFFQGWYFKICDGGQNIALVPSVGINKNGVKSAYIQVNTLADSYIFNFEYSEFFYDKKTKVILMGGNVFSTEGIDVNLKNDKAEIILKAEFEKAAKPKKHIMGPFRFLKLKCKHEIISLKHTVNGELKINGHEHVFLNAIGYTESDSGCSFPEKYLWLQCNDFMERESSLVLAIAKIPLLLFSFTGLICTLNLENKEYRFATYNFSKIKNAKPGEIVVKKGKLRLEIFFKSVSSNKLFYPKEGNMEGTINESLDGEIKIRLFKGKRLLLQELNGQNAGIEVFGY